MKISPNLLALLLLVLLSIEARPQATFTPLGDLSGGLVHSIGRDVSADGSVVVGTSRSARSNGFEAFRWTVAGGMVGLNDLPGGPFNSLANSVSADGTVVVGQGLGANGPEAFRWTVGGGIVGLGDLPIVGNGINPSGVQEGWVATIPEPSTSLMLGSVLTASVIVVLSTARRF